MYRAMSAADRDPDVSCFVIHGNETIGPILSGLADRGLLVHPGVVVGRIWVRCCEAAVG
jgi:hypothetical protein